MSSVIAEVKFSIEPLSSVMVEVQAMLEEYNAEIKLALPLNPDWAQFQILETCGSLLIVTARDEGKLVGYCAMILSNDITSLGLKTAFGLSLFLKKDHRNGHTGQALIHWSEQAASNAGATAIFIASQSEKEIGPLLRHKGYKVKETIFFKELH